MAPPRHVIRFTDGSEMPVGKIICLARTYRKHAEEMGGEVREEPLLFLKPSSAVIFDRQNIVLPRKSRDVHHEVEMTLVIGRQGKNIPVGESLRYIAGYCLALD
ncbi:MAG: fumarylacetoacetate hydrolase family protein, partial [Thermoplasmatota archaeon]